MKTLIFFFATLFTSISFSQESNFSKNELIVEFKTKIARNKTKLFKTNKRLKHINDSLKLESFKIIGNKKTRSTFLLKFKDDSDIKAIIDVYLKTNL